MNQNDIKVFSTPNPKTLKFMPKDFYFPIAASYELQHDDNPVFVNEILNLHFAELVFLNKNFISITRKEGKTWKDYQGAIVSIIQKYKADYQNLNNGSNIFLQNDNDFSEEAFTENFFELGSIEWDIQEILNQKIRPAVAKDGGDVYLVQFDSNFGVVYIKMMGACVGCPYSTATLKNGIENILRFHLPQINSVEAVL